MSHRFILKIAPVSAEVSVEVMTFVRQTASSLRCRATPAYRAHSSETLLVHVRTPRPTVQPLINEIVWQYPELQVQLVNDQGELLS